MSLLAKKGIFPITGPKVDGGDLYLYRRNDLTGLDIAGLVSNSNYVTFPYARQSIGAPFNSGFLRKRFCSSQMLDRSCPIPIAEWSAFRETYVTAAELVRGLHIRSDHLVDILAKRGISSITNPKIDGGNTYLFRRTDISGVDIAKLAADSKLAK